MAYVKIRKKKKPCVNYFNKERVCHKIIELYKVHVWKTCDFLFHYIFSADFSVSRILSYSAMLGSFPKFSILLNICAFFRILPQGTHYTSAPLCFQVLLKMTLRGTKAYVFESQLV